MTDIAFYHLQTTRLEAALPQLLAKCLERDWRVVVEVGDADRLAELDAHLWTFNDASFLPHAAQGDARPERQPIFLATSNDNPNKAAVRFFVEGAQPDESSALASYERAIVMFDGADQNAVSNARTLWKTLRGDGHDLSYWKQSEAGAWQRADQ